VDKQTALKMFTRWAAEYVLREDVLGSLESGKWADFIIIDRDYLNTPDEELSKINVQMTAVAGRPVYVDGEFAKVEGLQPVGLKVRPGR
jgi:predicted amidohydrolase YtcJ